MSLLLADTSAWHHTAHPDVAAQWHANLAADRVAVTPPMRLEVLSSARSARDYADISLELDALHQVRCDGRAFDHAPSVQQALSERGQRRSYAVYCAVCPRRGRRST